MPDLLRTALASPRRAAGTGVVAVVLLAATFSGCSRHEPPRYAAPSPAASTPAPSPTPSAASPTPSATPTPTPTSSRGTDAAQGSEDEHQAQADAALAFTRAWLDTSGGKAAWLKRLRPLSSQRLYQGFTYTDLANLPDDGVAGAESMQGGTYAATVVVRLASGDAVKVGVISTGQRWVVDDIEPVE